MAADDRHDRQERCPAGVSRGCRPLHPRLARYRALGAQTARTVTAHQAAHRGTAEFFARRHAYIAAEAGQEIEVVIIKAVAPPTAVLGMGHPDVCGEGEILIDPSRLEDVEHVSKITNAEFSPEWVRSQKWFEENE